MDDICKEVGISKKTMYAKIDNKAELIAFVVSDFMSKEEASIKQIKVESKDALDEMINIAKHILFFLRNMKPSLIYDLKKYYMESWNKLEKIHFEFIKSIIGDNINRGIEEGVYRKEINAEIISRIYLESSKSTSDEDVFPFKDFNRVKLFQQFIQYHMHGILNDAGLKKYKKYKEQL